MKTYEISKAGLEVLATGYKAVKYDNGTLQQFRYGEKGENLVGKIFKVDGDISECGWGLHFSKDPANVFNFYEPLGYNKYFKVNAYGKVIDSKNGLKSVAQTIEFVEEYDVMQYIELIKRYDRTADAVSSSYAVSSSNAVRRSDAVCGSNAVNWSSAVSSSNAVCGSNAVRRSNAVCGSYAVSWSSAVRGSYAVSSSKAVRGSYAVSSSNAVRGSSAVCGSYAVRGSSAVRGSYAVCGSYAVRGSYGLLKCDAVKYGIFCHKEEAAKYVMFNKKVTKERFEEVFAKIKSFNWTPKWDNFYDLKGDKEWWAIAFPDLMEVDNKTAWSKMPQEMIDYIKSLPEYNEKIFKAITELEV